MKSRPLMFPAPAAASLPLACAAFCLGFAHSGHAATSTWTSTTAATWTTVGSWDNGVPALNVDAILKATSGNLPTITPTAANMATLTLDGPSTTASVISSGNSTPLVQNMYGGTGKPLISITSNANSTVTFTKVNFKIRVNGELDIASGKTLTLGNSYISENSAGLKLTKTGGGTLAFTGSSTTKITFTGGLDMQEGTWIASQNSSSLPASGRVNFTNASGTNAKITVNTAASIEALAGGNANSTIDGNSALTVTGAQNTTYGGTIGGSVALKLTGNGSLALSGTSTYTGATTVSAGTLLVTGALGATHVTVNSGAFGGSGTVGGALDMAGGSLHVANLLNPLDVTGTVTIYSGFGIDDLAGLNWGSVANGTYTLINGTLGSGVFAALANNSPATAYNLGGGRSAYFEQGSLDLVVIPEPRAALLGGLALLGLLRRRR